MLLDRRVAELGSVTSPVGFETEGGGHWEVWDRYLTLDGKRAYHIGNICNTCTFFFKRLDGANRSLEEAQAVAALSAGLAKLDDASVQGLGQLLPPEQYIVCLLEARPALIAPGGPGDYFSREQIALWGTDPFWAMPHHPRTEYYRLGERPIRTSGQLFQFLMPMFPRQWLDMTVVSQYAAKLNDGLRPTAFAISVLDVKQPADWDEASAVAEHWCLAHYLLDGHHKVWAAAQAGRAITLISFLAVSRGIASADDVQEALATLAVPVA